MELDACLVFLQVTIVLSGTTRRRVDVSDGLCPQGIVKQRPYKTKTKSVQGTRRNDSNNLHRYRSLACPDRDARKCFFFDDNFLQVRCVALGAHEPPEGEKLQVL